jgi:hypothetical protein
VYPVIHQGDTFFRSFPSLPATQPLYLELDIFRILHIIFEGLLLNLITLQRKIILPLLNVKPLLQFSSAILDPR